MPLLFADNTTNAVTVPAATSLNTLPSSTVMMWVYPVDVANSGRHILSKADANIGAAGWSINRRVSNGGNWLLQVVRTTTKVTVDTGNNGMTAGVWQFLAYTWDIAGATNPAAYRGTLSDPATAITNSPSQGSGTQVDDSSYHLLIGARDGGGNGNVMPARVAFVAQWNRVLSLQELRMQQFHPRPTTGCVGFWYPGKNGTGPVFDESGWTQNDGTITGAVPVSDNVPRLSKNWKQSKGGIWV